jgi:hypothetical protein
MNILKKLALMGLFVLIFSGTKNFASYYQPLPFPNVIPALSIINNQTLANLTSNPQSQSFTNNPQTITINGKNFTVSMITFQGNTMGETLAKVLETNSLPNIQHVLTNSVTKISVYKAQFASPGTSVGPGITLIIELSL